jgi:hypothetical protein
MPIARITVTAVTDEGNHVILWGRPERAKPGTGPVGFAFLAKGDGVDAALAERASRLTSGTEATIDFSPVVDGWNLGRGLSASQ